MATKETINVPLEDLSREQLIAAIRRLQAEMEQFLRTSDRQARESAEHWERAYHEVGGLLEGIADVMLANGYRDTSRAGILRCCQKAIRMMASVEKNERPTPTTDAVKS